MSEAKSKLASTVLASAGRWSVSPRIWLRSEHRWKKPTCGWSLAVDLGVTAAAVIGVAAASKDAGASFHLLGRTPLMEVTEAWLDHDNAALESEKMALRERI